MAVREGNYYADSAEYRKYFDALQRDQTITTVTPSAHRLHHTNQLNLGPISRRLEAVPKVGWKSTRATHNGPVR